MRKGALATRRRAELRQTQVGAARKATPGAVLGWGTGQRWAGGME